MEVFWEPLTPPGMEHLAVREDSNGAYLDGLVIGVHEGTPFRARYEILVDPDWNVRRCVVELPGAGCPAVTLTSSGAGTWTLDGPRPDLNGCIDIDLSISPSTNTLPVRRLKLGAGESAEIDVAYIAVPDLTVRHARQRYTCLRQEEQGGLYRYESLSSGFVADLAVDEHGFVIDYPGWRRRLEWGA